MIVSYMWSILQRSTVVRLLLLMLQEFLFASCLLLICRLSDDAAFYLYNSHFLAARDR